MGMTVGQEVFDTCVWIGRFWEIALRSGGYEPKRIYRREEKLNLCGCLSAKDKNIRQALIDRYGVVGTKKRSRILLCERHEVCKRYVGGDGCRRDIF